MRAPTPRGTRARSTCRDPRHRAGPHLPRRQRRDAPRRCSTSAKACGSARTSASGPEGRLPTSAAASSETDEAGCASAPLVLPPSPSRAPRSTSRSPAARLKERGRSGRLRKAERCIRNVVVQLRASTPSAHRFRLRHGAGPADHAALRRQRPASSSRTTCASWRSSLMSTRVPFAVSRNPGCAGSAIRLIATAELADLLVPCPAWRWRRRARQPPSAAWWWRWCCR